VTEQVNRELRNWYQNEVDENTKRPDSRDNVKHNEKSDQLFFRENDECGRARVSTDEKHVLRGR